jgi:hypothetical protein
LSQIQIRRDIATNWVAVNPVLAPGEWGLDTTNKLVKMGDGVASWNTLARVLSPRIGTVTSSAAPTANADAHDQFNVTALAVGATIGAPTGTPFDGQKLMYRIKDNGTAQTLAYNAIFRAVAVLLPSATTFSRALYIGTVYNAQDSKWDIIAIGQL